MHQLDPSAAQAQHLPEGWSFPALEPMHVPSPQLQVVPAPAVVGGGMAEQTEVRLRWGRVLVVLVAVAVLGLVAWNGTRPGATTDPAATVSGGGSSEELDVDRPAGASDTGDAAALAPSTRTPTVTPARTAKPRGARGGGGSGRSPRRAAATVAAATATGGGVATAAPRPAADRASGSGGGELPITGLETWIAAFLGLLLLAGGICVHVNAVRIAATALLYRRGILLRPVDCARLARERGLVQRARLLLSSVLHRLLEEPADGDFVAARLAR